MTDRTWTTRPMTETDESLAQIAPGHPLVVQTLRRRGFTTVEAARAFLDPAYYTPASPDDLPDMVTAVDRILRAIDQDEVIQVWGDFDVDGQTATSLLVSALGDLGATVRYYIPDRENEGHGVYVPRLQELIHDGAQLILTCDTGIAAHEAVEAASALGVDVIITDHHQLPEILPDAYAAVNPQRLPEDHPLRTLPGVGVAYKLVEALHARLNKPEPAHLLDLVALGIVADVAVQVADTRYLLQRGLAQLNHPQRLGLQALYAIAEVDHVDSETIGFVLGPRLNALGRLGDANEAVEFLTTNDAARAEMLARLLDGYNIDRKLLTDQVFEAAQKQIAADPALLHDYAVLVLSHDTWPGGVIGIVANRLVELYRKPVILFTTPGEVARGSARSVAGVDITAAIAQHAAMLTRFGGHTMAAGMSLPAVDLPRFRAALSTTVRAMRQDNTLDGGDLDGLTIDAWLPLEELTLDLVDELAQLAPFGPGNPPLVLATEKLTVTGRRSIGRSGDHMRLRVEDDTENMRELLWWRADLDRLPRGRVDVAYHIGANVFRGERSLQLELIDLRPVAEEPATFSQREDLSIIDHRELSRGDQMGELIDLPPETLIWSEVERVSGVSSVTRTGLDRAETLVIWTAPPDQATLQAVLDKVNPSHVVLFGVDPGTDTVQKYIHRLGGLIQHAMNQRGGEVPLDALAANLGHTADTVRAGLEWMAQRGQIHYTVSAVDVVNIHPGDKVPAAAELIHAAEAKLVAMLQEAAAYRTFFRKAQPQILLRS